MFVCLGLLGGPRDVAMAFSHFSAAAEVRCAATQTRIPSATVFHAAWHGMASQAGEGSAFYNLGLAYETGVGVPHDWALALEW